MYSSLHDFHFFNYIEYAIESAKMEAILNLKAKRKTLLEQYKTLIEEAYNLRETDSAMSDISEFKAMELMEQLNKIKYLDREASFS